MVTSGTDADELRESVRRHYADRLWPQLRQRLPVAGRGQPASASEGVAAFYDAVQREVLPDAAVLASLGCGNPTAVASWPKARRSSTWAGRGIDVLCRPGGSGPP